MKSCIRAISDWVWSVEVCQVGKKRRCVGQEGGMNNVEVCQVGEERRCVEQEGEINNKSYKSRY